jgi:tetratricopeptide (TPR) repeat protein
LKNTDREIAAQDPNMARQLSQILNEYGLVVVGYSGGDESVMNILSGISEKNDFYWCVKSGTEPKNSVKNLLQQKHGVLIEIDGFDEMMNEIGEIVGFDLPSIVEAMHDRQNALIERLRSFTTNPRNSPKILRQLVEALKAQSERQEEQIRKTEALDWFMRAYEAQNEGKHSEAEKLYRKAIELHPTDAMAHNNLGWSYHNEFAHWADAEREYKRAIELDPNLDLAYQNLSNLYQSQGRSIEAIPFLQRFIKLRPGSTSGYVGLGYSYLLMGQMNKAGEEFEKARRLDAKDYNVILNIGILRLMEGHKRDAIAMWRNGLELCHDESMFGKTNRVLYTFAIGRTNDGLRSMAHLIQATKPGPATLNMALEDAKQLARAPTPPKQIKRMIALLQNALAAAKRRATKIKERLT